MFFPLLQCTETRRTGQAEGNPSPGAQTVHPPQKGPSLPSLSLLLAAPPEDLPAECCQLGNAGEPATIPTEFLEARGSRFLPVLHPRCRARYRLTIHRHHKVAVARRRQILLQTAG
ncbi:E4 early protein [Bos taurus papillomavirus 32]|nr:E4 early protein [Bos taurus papillomavirus 32]